MKQFGGYQYVGGEMSDRDKQEVGSKFWNEGKWENYVLPFLPEDCTGMTYVEMGSNAGLFLKLAEEKGFKEVIGIDANREAYKRALAYREENGGHYKLERKYMENGIDDLPMADYTVLSNTHYYFLINNWLDYLDKLKTKTRYCIIITADKRSKPCWASADVIGIREYFKDWEEIGLIDDVLMKGDPFPRKLYGLCFKSGLIERVPIDELGNGNSIQGGYYKQLDKGRDPLKTYYYKRQRVYRHGKWSDRRLNRHMQLKAELYDSVKKVGLLKPIIVGKNNRIIDGNHRHAIMKHLGHTNILIRRA